MGPEATWELWKRCNEGWDKDPEFGGAAVWNAWATKLLERKNDLLARHLWRARLTYKGSLRALNEETSSWISDATADFSGREFSVYARFGGFIFPANALFADATFHKGAGFMSCEFGGFANFEKCKFLGDSGYKWQQVDGGSESCDVGWGSAVFLSGANFNGAIFNGKTMFGQATFAKSAWFIRAQFDMVRFWRVQFEHDVYFSAAEFRQRSSFGGVSFMGYTEFDDAKFIGLTEFNAVKAEREVSFGGECTFGYVPSFASASFKEPPRLDRLRIDGAVRSTTRRDAELPEGHDVYRSRVPGYYRSLKRLASQGQDLEREQAFFAGEVQSSRFSTDWPLPFRSSPKFQLVGWASVWRFWFGVAYQVFSNFGRSIVRPLVAWLLLLVVSAAVYLGESPMAAKIREHDAVSTVAAWRYARSIQTTWVSATPCASDADGVKAMPSAIRESTNAPHEALQLALMNGSVIGEFGGRANSARILGCLYGLAPGDGGEATMYPAAVSTMGLFQRALSAISIFLFGLAVRNMLKMK